MRIIPFLIIFLWASSLYASTESYVVEKPDGSVSVIHYNKGSEDTLDQVLMDFGLYGNPIRKIKESDIPKDRQYREAWTFIGGKISVDSFKKKEIDDAKVKSVEEAVNG